MYEDNWKPKGNGIHNYPIPIEGKIVEEYTKDNEGYTYRVMSTGNVYKRHVNFFYHSPYG